MGSVFAVSVQSGKEILAKEMLLRKFVESNESLIKGIYALETHTKFIKLKENKEICKNSVRIDESDVSTHLQMERYRTAINSKESQLKALNRYQSQEHKDDKKRYRKEIKLLRKKMTELRKSSRNIHSVLKGYILIEFNLNSEYMPGHIYHLINETIYVNSVLSTMPIPHDEFNQFISNMDKLVEPEIVIELEKEKDVQKINNMISSLINEYNQKATNKDRKREIEEKIEELQFDTTKEIKKSISNNSELKQKIKTFTRRGQKKVSMPFSTFEKMYNDKEIEEVSHKGVDKEDLVTRVEQLSLFEDVDVIAS